MKKSLLQKLDLREKGMAILVDKAECFESKNYRNVSTKELDVLLNCYGVEKKATKKAEQVAQWREIRAANSEPPMVDMWTAEDKEQLQTISNKEIDMSVPYLGRYAAIQKRTPVAAVLDFTDEKWESLKALREADGAERNQGATTDDNGNYTGGHLGQRMRRLGALLTKERCKLKRQIYLSLLLCVYSIVLLNPGA